MFFFSFVTGKLFDEGYFRYLFVFGSIWSVFSLMMVSLAKVRSSARWTTVYLIFKITVQRSTIKCSYLKGSPLV